MRAVAVAGATGALGSRICAALLERGASVRALVREPASAEARALADRGAELATADVTAPATLAPALAGVDVVVSTVTCFPRGAELEEVDRRGNVALVDAAERAGAARFVFVSFKPVPLEFPLQSAKRAVEERLERSPLEAVVLRPGKFMDIWFSPLCSFDAAAGRATIFGGGTAPVTWIAAADVAAIAATAALNDVPEPHWVVELGGPEPLSQRDVVAIYEEVTGADWELDTMPAPELERMRSAGENDTVRSLGALMLEAHLGAVTDPASFRDALPMELTTVRQFAEARYRGTTE